MRDKSQFPSVLKTAFAIMTALYAAVGIAGMIIYGESTEPLLTQNFEVWPKGFFSILVISKVLIVFFRQYWL